MSIVLNDLKFSKNFYRILCFNQQLAPVLDGTYSTHWFRQLTTLKECRDNARKVRSYVNGPISYR